MVPVEWEESWTPLTAGLWFSVAGLGGDTCMEADLVSSDITCWGDVISFHSCCMSTGNIPVEIQNNSMEKKYA